MFTREKMCVFLLFFLHTNQLITYFPGKTKLRTFQSSVYKEKLRLARMLVVDHVLKFNIATEEEEEATKEFKRNLREN